MKSSDCSVSSPEGDSKMKTDDVNSDAYLNNEAKSKRRRLREVGTMGEGRGKWTLRSTCDGCTVSKVRCNGGRPCARCVRRNDQCIYSEKRRCGPKRRKFQDKTIQVPKVIAASTKNLLGMDKTAPLNILNNKLGPHLVPNTSRQDIFILDVPKKVEYKKIELKTKEEDYWNIFNSTVNEFLPLVSSSSLRIALQTEPFNNNSLIGSMHKNSGKKEYDLYHICKAMLYAGLAIGAQYVAEEEEAALLFNRADFHIRNSFDAILPEAAACFVLFVIYHTRTLDKNMIFKYLEFARHSFGLLPLQVQKANHEVFICIGFLSKVFKVNFDQAVTSEMMLAMFDQAKPNGIESLALSTAMYNAFKEFDTASKCRILTTLTYSIEHMEKLNIESDKIAIEKLENEEKILKKCLDSSKSNLPNAPSPPSDLFIIAVKGTLGYFKIKNGCSKDEILKNIVEPISNIVRNNPIVLNFPMGWHFSKCILALMKKHGNFQKLEEIMEQYKGRIPFSNYTCETGKIIYDMFENACFVDDPEKKINGADVSVVEKSSPEFIDDASFFPRECEKEEKFSQDGVISSKSSVVHLPVMRQSSFEQVRMSVRSNNLWWKDIGKEV